MTLKEKLELLRDSEPGVVECNDPWVKGWVCALNNAIALLDAYEELDKV